MMHMASNTGQNCNAPSRMLAPKAKYDEVVAIAADTAKRSRCKRRTKPKKARSVRSRTRNQFQKVQGLIQKGIDEGATLVAGGVGRPEGFNRGYFVKPTVFANVNNEMTIAREEIFGPVLTIIPYETEEEAIRIANDTPYGLSAMCKARPSARAKWRKRLRAGKVHINGADGGIGTPFGGYKQSGIGREGGSSASRNFSK